MTDYAFPDVPIAQAVFRLHDGVKRFYSPLSQTLRTEEVHAPYWTASLSFVNLTTAQAQLLQSAHWRINGAEHRILVPMQDYERAGAGGGTPRVNGGSQTGLTLATDGWPSSALVLKAGDRFSVSDQAFVVADDVTSSGGAATITLANRIRTAPIDNALLEIDTPVVACSLESVFGLNAVPGKRLSGVAEYKESYP